MPKKAYISPSPKAYSPQDPNSPVALTREQTTRNQIRWDTETIIWGEADDLPLRILNAVNKSPTATSCLSKTEKFITGSGFTDEGLMTHVIDKDGTTLWDFHTQIVPYLTLLESFAVNFKFDRQGRITNSYVVGAESCRFVKPIDGSKKILSIKFNPYFGTAEYNNEFTSVFPVFDLDAVTAQVKTIDDNYQGQIYFFGTVRPPFKFYAVPKYWSAEDSIYVDAGVQTYSRKNMENGFFQSTLINVIGNPNQKSQNPKYIKEVTGTDGRKRNESTKTVGEEFDDQMQEIFSGVRKAGTAMVLWSLNKDQAVTLQPFPTGSNADILKGTADEAKTFIYIATEVDPILLTVQNNGLSNAGDSVRAVIEYKQSMVAKPQNTLEQFYNKIMLPNLQNKVKQEVKIKNYIPIQTQVVVEDKFWQTLKDSEKRKFVKEKVQGMAEVLTDDILVDPATGDPISPQETQLNENISKLSTLDIIRMQSIANRYHAGTLNLEQAKILLKAKGLTDLDVNTWLGITEAPMEAVTE